MLNYESLPGQLLALLQAGRALTVRWNCGGDENFVTTQLDGVEQVIDLGADYRDWMFAEYDEYKAYMSRLTNLPLLLDGFLTERLGLPSVGEFSMHGTGRIFQESTAIVIEYQSEATLWDDGDLSPDERGPLEYYLTTDELAELFPDHLPGAPASTMLGQESPSRRIDHQTSADYSGRTILFRLDEEAATLHN